MSNKEAMACLGDVISIEYNYFHSNWIATLFIMLLRNTHSENTSSNKTEALTKSIIIYIWVIGILNQLFMRNSYTQIKFSKK